MAIPPNTETMKTTYLLVLMHFQTQNRGPTWREIFSDHRDGLNHGSAQHPELMEKSGDYLYQFINNHPCIMP